VVRLNETVATRVLGRADPLRGRDPAHGCRRPRRL